MTEQSLGLIETIGLTAAVEAADAAVKAANVTLVGYELAKGEGMTVVKLLGEVGAIKAAVSAGAAAAGRVNRVVSVNVIARPARDVAKLVDSPETVGVAAQPRPAEKPVKAEPAGRPEKPAAETTARQSESQAAGPLLAERKDEAPEPQGEPQSEPRREPQAEPIAEATNEGPDEVIAASDPETPKAEVVQAAPPSDERIKNETAGNETAGDETAEIATTAELEAAGDQPGTDPAPEPDSGPDSGSRKSGSRNRGRQGSRRK